MGVGFEELRGQFVDEFEVLLPVVREAVELEDGEVDEGCLDSCRLWGIFNCH